MEAVVFDFFGTLTDPSREAGRRGAYDATAVALGVPQDRFWKEATGSFSDRATGAFGDTTSTLRALAQRCGVTPSDHELGQAVTAHYCGAELLHAPRPGALDVLHELRSRGFRLGLLSDCSSELCELWPAGPYVSYFDAVVFSWAQGYRKPDRRGFLETARLLGVPPARCWFVGDGGSREMTGALAAGMRPVLVTNAAHTDHAQYRDDPDAFVPPDVVDDITEIPALVGDVSRG